jgi:2',3'-cyclic-nucleotide 2'-phosphodiesterase (5'-nucleotidase family)
MRRFHVWTGGVLAWAACVLAWGIVGADGDGKQAGPEILKVTLLHLNDTYEIEPLARGAIGGPARVAILRRRLLQENPHTYVLHAGDFLSPSAYFNATVDGRRLAGRWSRSSTRSASTA